MKETRSSGAWRMSTYLVLGLVASCARIPDTVATRGPGGVLVESVFMEGGHPPERCLSGLAKSLRDLPDGVLFFDRADSRIRVTPPRGPSIESYHVHLIHRVGGDVLDHVVRQNDAGLIDLDLSRFDQPEELIVLSSSYRFSKSEDAPAKEQGGREQEAQTPPYAMAFRLVPADQSELVMSLQPFRYVVETNLGNLSLFVQSFNRRDMLLTWVDPGKKMGTLIKEDPYIHLKKQDAYIPPRLVVDVLTGKGDLPWQRAGTWHLPGTALRSENASEAPFAFRIPGSELISFGPPARVDFTLPEQSPATSARIEAKYSGVRPKDSLRLVFAVQYPTGRAKETAFRIETQDVTPTTGKGTFLADFGDQDPARFPINSALVHRFVQPWRLHGGAYTPEQPLGTSKVSLEPKAGPGKLHARVVAPRYASHYDFLSFLGDARGKSALDGLLRGGPGSPNTTPPPGGGGGGGPGTGPGPGDDGGGSIPPPGGTPLRPGGIGGAGNQSNCGCGPGPAPGMPSPGCPSNTKCKGQCGQACPGNGHCKNDNNGHVNLEFPCPPHPKGCGQDRATGECKCGKHSWNKDAAMEAVQQMFPGAADYSWFGQHNGWAPCDETTQVGVVRITYWAAAGFGQTHVFCTVSATFGPCRKDPNPGQGKPGGGLVGGEPGNTGGPASGPGPTGGGSSTIAITSTIPNGATTATVQGLTLPIGNVTTHPVGANDPNTMVQASSIGNALGMYGALSTGFFQYDQATLMQVISSPATSIAEVYNAANKNTVTATMANADTELNLPFFLEGLLESVGGGGGPPGGVPPPIPPGCGALGIEFILGISVLTALLRRISR